MLPASTDIVARMGSRARKHEHCKREQCKWEQRKWEQCKWEQRKWEQAKAAPASMGALFHVGYLQLQSNKTVRCCTQRGKRDQLLPSASCVQAGDHVSCHVHAGLAGCRRD